MAAVELLFDEGVTMMAIPPSCTVLKLSKQRATSGGMVISWPTGNLFIKSAMRWIKDVRSVSYSHTYSWDDPLTKNWNDKDLLFVLFFLKKKLTSLSSRVYFDWLALKLFSKIRVVTLADCSWACNSRTCFWRTMLDSSRKRVFSIKSSVACWCCGLIGDAIPATISSCNTWYSTS